ncbi:hypothetical protein VNO77_21873 [Canavalia gladiata]|uniref:Uncharacterized protein n=1 Tax=Canavalia gladiata TaxID=3824 RepID=A0AAN9QA98_CANGL
MIEANNLLLQHFLLKDNNEGMGFGGSESGRKTVIFSPRVCNNVHLEVGNLIRIHPPWKEVQVGNDNIIMCTYFSEMFSPAEYGERTDLLRTFHEQKLAAGMGE